MSKQYETVIGLEVHVELATKTKIFCGCSTAFGGAPNTHTCPVCTGMPGSLPVLNKQVVEYAVAVGLATNCHITQYCKFDRKNYFYPDNPQNYQISQLYLPICRDGYVEIETPGGGSKQVGIHEIHMEEDAGKLIHDEWEGCSLVDYNRSGVPLIEIVSEPDMRSADEVIAYLEKLRLIIQYLGASDCKLQEGSMRADVNLSVREVGAEKFGTRTEMKNINSFKAVEEALEYEIERQEEVLEDGGHVIQETRTWDPDRGITLSMRSKENAHDYRYMPEPDLVPIITSDEEIEAYRKSLPELPDARQARLESEYGLSSYDAGIITSSRQMAEYFDEVVAAGADAKLAANWIMGDLSKNLNAEGIGIEASPVDAKRLGEMICLISKGTISSKIAKKVFEEMWKSPDSPEKIVKDKGLVQITDTKAIEAIVDKVIADNPKAVEEYKGGKKKAIGSLVGQVMKQSKGKANPQMVNELLTQKLG